MPLANDFKADGEPREGFVPVEILWCKSCALAQTSAVVDPHRLYSKYCYITSRSETMHQHFRSLWEEIKTLGSHEHVLEVGSNTGDFLSYVKSNGAESVLGIDPAENLCAIAEASGVITLRGLFCESVASMASVSMPVVDVIVARHVFAHADDWHGFIKCMDVLSKMNTLICIEVPYLLDTLARVEFDQFYLEHLSYVTIQSLQALLENSVFRLHKIVRFPVHGGAVCVFLRRKDHASEPDKSVQEFLNSERITTDTWWSFSEKAHKRIKHLSGLVKYALGKSKIVFYGASAKSSVWISACGFNHHNIKFIVDDTPQKQGKCSPGTSIPIVPENQLTITKADYAILGAWNFASEIEAKNQKFIQDGGVFLNPHDPCHITD